ncbi:5816_t:CDS:1, partial [Paraglomus occultum]
RSVNLLDHLQHIHNTLNPRVPPIETITKQRSAVNPILHDKLYTPDEISPPAGECAMPIEERIARLWHKDLTWRKVVVRLEGEAHLSVIVRREWLNKEGKQVIEHLLNEHEF